MVRLMTLLAMLLGSVAMAEEVNPPTLSKAILAGGCFWCVEHDMRQLAGVTDVVSGYTGGNISSPTYENYHDDGPGQVPHVEAVEITYDPARLSYGALLDYFVRHIDPTDGGGQFCDRGPAYRPVIFVANAAEEGIAKARLAEAAKVVGKPLRVEILQAGTFWPAEGYHQDYAAKNPTKYNFYRWRCGRDARVKDVWGGNP